MFTADIHTVYEAIDNPVWVSHGVRGDFTDYRGINIVQDKPNWTISVFKTGALPYFEMPTEFHDTMDTILDDSSLQPIT